MDSNSSFTSNYDISAYAFGARANWFKNGNYSDGLYVGPSLRYVNAQLSTTDVLGTTTGSASAIFVGCLVGYGWFWNSFNMMLGGGFTQGLGDTKITITDSSGNKTDVSTAASGGLALEYTLGWTF